METLIAPAFAGGDIIRELLLHSQMFFSLHLLASSHFKQSSENSYEYYTEYVIMSSILYKNADISRQQREIRCSVVKKEFFNAPDPPPSSTRALLLLLACTLDDDFRAQCLELFSGQYLS